MTAYVIKRFQNKGLAYKFIWFFIIITSPLYLADLEHLPATCEY